MYLLTQNNLLYIIKKYNVKSMKFEKLKLNLYLQKQKKPLIIDKKNSS